MASPSSNVAAVQSTNDDATASKLSCVQKGYIKDNYVHLFVRRPVKRSPIINRGYYARWAALRKLLFQFLEAGTQTVDDIPLKKQVLSLGAGYDTTFFQLKEEGRAPTLYVELDFKEVTSRKAAIINSHEQLRDKLGKSACISQERGEVHSEQYKLLPVDLRNINGLDAVFDLAQLDPGLPTFIIAECVLIYLEPHVSRTLVKWTAEKFSSSVFIIYEQIHPEDAFGQQMIKNLESRGCALLSLNDTPTLEAKQALFTDLGWQKAVALDMDTIYNKGLDLPERRRIERLELFDEFEEWHIMQEHYCVAYGINDSTGLLQNIGFHNV
uniref:Leucine carboxyl methyltransferase 1 homolog n=1 Tax=Araucaria cunninghamii TaxID=56994 RepID=A0A0D6R1K3_ARACU